MVAKIRSFALAMILHQVVGLPSEDAMAEHAGTHAPIEVFRTVLALMPAPARAMFDAALERHESRMERPQDNPNPSQDDFEHMVAGIAAGDGAALTQFADYLSELALAEQLVGHIMYLMMLTLPEAARAKFLGSGAEVIPFPGSSGERPR